MNTFIRHCRTMSKDVSDIMCKTMHNVLNLGDASVIMRKDDQRMTCF